MKTFKISILDKVTGEIEPVERFTESKDKNISDRLLELQEGYCEDESPTLTHEQITVKGRKIVLRIAESEADFCYLAPIEVIKTQDIYIK